VDGAKRLSSDEVICRYEGWGCCGYAETPGPPEDVMLSDVTNTLCKLTWNAPEYDGGSPVIGYYVERYIESSWNRVNSTPIPTCSVSIELLATNSGNEFRICAENTVGVGPPSKTVMAPYKGMLVCRITQSDIIVNGNANCNGNNNSNFHFFETSESIVTKFCTVIKTTKYPFYDYCCF